MSDYTPKVFISYSWDSKEHKERIKKFATQLLKNGVNAVLDQWENVPGDSLTHFMEKAIRENDFIIIVCTPNYKEKSDQRKGGVGYEGDIMTPYVLSDSNTKRFIPILMGPVSKSIPTWLQGKYYLDFEREKENSFQDLIVTLFGENEKPPALGKRVQSKSTSETVSDKSYFSKDSDEFEPIKIEGVKVNEVGKPKNDGSRGSALYKVPFKLSKRAPYEWHQLFEKHWNRPPRFSSMHRPGIAGGYSDTIYLDGTTIEEVERTHRDTLLLAVEEANKEYQKIKEVEKKRNAQEEKFNEEHGKQVKNISNRLKF